MDRLWVYTHLGIGDHIVCKPIIKHLSSVWDEVVIFAKKQSYDSISFIYCDIENVDIIPVDSDAQAREKTTKAINMLILGHEFLDTAVPFDVSFYNQVQLPIKRKWDGFTLARDYEDEQEVYNKVVKQEKYIVCHTDNKRGTKHLDLKETEDHQIIHIDPALDGRSHFCSWLGVIEKATGVVVSNSSYLNLINQLDICKGKRFYYRGIAPIATEQPTLRDGWKFL